MVGDPDLLKHILVKDFDHFVDRMDLHLSHEKDKLLSEMLSLKKGDEWRHLRPIMSPTFTSGKMKGMFPLVCDKADDLVTFCLKEALSKSCIDMKDNFGRFTIDTIASCAFGIECNSLEDKNAPFPKNAERFFSPNRFVVFKLAIMGALPKLGKLFNMQLSLPETEFFEEVARHTLEERLKGEKRGDFLDLLLEGRSRDGETRKVSNNDRVDGSSNPKCK